MSTETTKLPIVFIHGMWLHGESWHKWMELFRQHGYDAILQGRGYANAASWPGDGETTTATRKNAAAVGGYGVTEIADYIAKQLAKFVGVASPLENRQPILIGHSFGGLIVQNSEI